MHFDDDGRQIDSADKRQIYGQPADDDKNGHTDQHKKNGCKDGQKNHEGFPCSLKLSGLKIIANFAKARNPKRRVISAKVMGIMTWGIQTGISRKVAPPIWASF